MKIEIVRREDLDDLLPLMRGYSDFYRVNPSDEELLALAEALIADPQHDGVQFIARDDDGTALGFATLYWVWSTLQASRTGLMNDLFVAESARRRGIARALINACADKCRERSLKWLTWETEPHNFDAQKLYDQTGAIREERVEYRLSVDAESS